MIDNLNKRLGGDKENVGPSLDEEDRLQAALRDSEVHSRALRRHLFTLAHLVLSAQARTDAAADDNNPAASVSRAYGIQGVFSQESFSSTAGGPCGDSLCLTTPRGKCGAAAPEEMARDWDSLVGRATTALENLVGKQELRERELQDAQLELGLLKRFRRMLETRNQEPSLASV
mmetsp:Transcript_75594/g.202385  ORF Transcript_75594/g.202385 Transcript_75594/m.202385 type:complete len:174 (+) Transcript_75594:876-1397(+)